MVFSGCSGSDGAGDPGAGEAAVAVRDLVQVLLMDLLGVPEGAGRTEFGGDRIESGVGEGPVVGGGGPAGDLLLFRGGPVDDGSVLGADVVALSVHLGGIVFLEEGAEQVLVGDH